MSITTYFMLWHLSCSSSSPFPSPVQIPLFNYIVPRQRKAMEAVEIIRRTTSDLIKKCKEMVDEEEMAAAAAASASGGEYINQSDPSVLRFLIAAREEVRMTVNCGQLRHIYPLCMFTLAHTCFPSCAAGQLHTAS